MYCISFHSSKSTIQFLFSEILNSLFVFPFLFLTSFLFHASSISYSFVLDSEICVIIFVNLTCFFTPFICIKKGCGESQCNLFGLMIHWHLLIKYEICCGILKKKKKKSLVTLLSWPSLLPLDSHNWHITESLAP